MLCELTYMWGQKHRSCRNREKLPGSEGWKKWGDVGPRVQTSGYKTSKFWGLVFNTVTIINKTGVHTQKLL